ncbi:uncharacterized protein LOC141910001 [Tubulanus polymorphus]|uniref:uncharacterized protein LOC141910001 n=1 Tax=Tubulanus polymorphus TaxID=672921 RepID=UPI003DA2C982
MTAKNGKLLDKANNIVDSNKVIVGDNWYLPRRAIVVNGTLPGPRLDVYEGQKLVINVHNKMFSDSTTIHWHGLHSKSTPYFDGASFINMCPIPPSLIVTSPIMAAPYGTHWYHTHVGFQMGDGMFGPLIVHKKNAPQYAGDFVMTLALWNHHHGTNEWFLYEENHKMFSQLNKKYHNETKFRRFSSGLINGKGRFQAVDGTFITDGPLETYTVEPGKKYLFRIIGAQAHKQFAVSFHGHQFQVVASDGADIKPFMATSVIVSGGERFDVILTADQPVDNYWIEGYTKDNWKAHAILHYNGAPNADPTGPLRNPLVCSAAKPCTEVCDYPKPKSSNINCETFGTIKSLPAVPPPAMTHNSPKDIFLNFGRPGYTGKGPPTINGIQFKFPTTSVLSDPNTGITECDPSKCGTDKLCACTHHYHIRKGSTIQMVFMSMGKGRGTHPIHLHGHYFSVLKVGYPRVDANGKFLGDNSDIVCDGSFCNQGSWKDPAWNKQIPGLNLVDPPLKDTLNIKPGGYAVVRFKADNPGVWILHCHIEEHLAGGMALVFLEGQEEWNVPDEFPQCGHYTPFFTRKAAKMSKKRSQLRKRS